MNRTTSDVSADVALRLIADERRRRVLRYLAENGGEPVSIDRLVDGITDPVSSSREEQPYSNRSVTTELYHNHLPKLGDSGVIEFDRGEATVLYRPHDGVEGLLEYVGESFE